MREGRPLREMMYLKIMSQVVPYLPDNEKEMLLFLTSYMSKMKYKRSSRDAHEFGLLMVSVLPALSAKLAELSRQKDLLELRCSQLERLIEDQASKIKGLVEESIRLLVQLRQKDHELFKLATDFGRELLQSLEREQIIGDINSASSMLNQAYEGIIRDLTTFLAGKSPEAAMKLLDLVSLRHTAEITLAEEYKNRAEEMFRELKQRIASEGKDT
jgi:hypothetical protein